MMTIGEFEEVLKELHQLASNHGIDSLEQAGYQIKGPEDLKSLPNKGTKIFIRGCHVGFQYVQAKIGQRLLTNFSEAQSTKEVLHESVKRRDKAAMKAAEATLNELTYQELLLRRILDEVLLQIVGPETWVFRRLQLRPEMTSIDPKILESTLQIASDLNKEDRMAFHLITDMLSSVHVGDLIRVDKNRNATKRWSIIELKSGKMNEILLKTKAALGTDVEINDLENEVRAKHGEKAVKQLQRMIRQETRQKRVEEIIATDKGIDPVYEEPITLKETSSSTEDYFQEIRSICSLLKTKQIAAAKVHGCLNILGIRSEVVDKYGIGIVAHHFHHLRADRKECLLDKGETLCKQELDEMRSLKNFQDLLWINLSSGWSITIFQWPIPNEDTFNIAMERFRIFVQIDYPALFERAKAMGISIEWIPADLKGIKGEERAYLHRMTYRIPGSPNACAIRTTGDDGKSALMMSGFVNRLLVEHMTPNYWLNLLGKSIGWTRSTSKMGHLS